MCDSRKSSLDSSLAEVLSHIHIYANPGSRVDYAHAVDKAELQRQTDVTADDDGDNICVCVCNRKGVDNL